MIGVIIFRHLHGIVVLMYVFKWRLCLELCSLKDEHVLYFTVLTEKEGSEVKVREERRKGMIPC
jgi:hypothetical protein